EGVSDRPDRSSDQVSLATQEAGYKIIPVNPKVDQVLNEKAYASLRDIKEPIDVINVFRRSEFLPEVAEEAIQTDCKVFWAQQGVGSIEAYNRLKENHFTVIMDLCIKVAQVESQ